MYDFGHPRTTKAFDTTWSELKSALGEGGETGLLLAASGSQLLLDGVALESFAAERSFAQLLSSAGIASIHFSPRMTKDGLARFARAFPSRGGAKPASLAEQLKAALDDECGIRVNEVCFVPADSSVARTTIAAQLAAQSLGIDVQKSLEWLSDPKKLLQLLTASEGARASGGSQGGGPGNSQGGGSFGGGWSEGGSGGSGHASGGGTSSGTFVPVDSKGGDAEVPAGFKRAGPKTLLFDARMFDMEEEEFGGIMQMISQLAKASRSSDAEVEPSSFQAGVSSMPASAQSVLRRALAALAEQAPADGPDQPMLLKLAENLAIRIALDRYERGDIQVNAVGQMLERMSKEVEALHKILGSHEETMARAGITVQHYTDLLAQEFWTEVPLEDKRKVLESADAWCIPPQNVREFIEDHIERKEMEEAKKVLRNYTSCINGANAGARRTTATGLADLADLYAATDERLLMETLREVGLCLSQEQDPGLQSLISAAFVRLAQEASQHRSYAAMQRAVEMVDYVETERPGVGKSLRTHVSIVNRLPEFIDEAVRAEAVPDDLARLLRRVPRPAAELLTSRFSRCTFREESQRVLEMMNLLGPEALAHLRENLTSGSAVNAVETLGLLSYLDPDMVETLLPQRLTQWQRSSHDRAVRQLASSGAPERGRLLLAIFDSLDPMIRSLATDEIGISGEDSGIPRLLRLAEGDLPEDCSSYLQLKAIEALGRLRASAGDGLLRQILETKQLWRWAYAGELRIAAAQAQEKIDPEWMKRFMPRSGIDPFDLALEPLDIDAASSCIRQRRYPRLRLERPISATSTNLRDNCKLEIADINLGGGVAVCEQPLHPGTIIALRLSARGVRAKAVVRDSNTQARTFEVVEIDLDERNKLRHLLLQMGGAPLKASVESRKKTRGRELIVGPR
jgi:hypothetical protein